MRSAAASSNGTRPLAVIGAPRTTSPSRALRRRLASSFFSLFELTHLRAASHVILDPPNRLLASLDRVAGGFARLQVVRRIGNAWSQATPLPVRSQYGSEVRPAILHLRDLRVGIVGVRP